MLPSGKTLGKSISDFNGHAQKNWETKNTITSDLQVLTRKIIAHKPSFYVEANQLPKAQYGHKLQDTYYAAVAHSMFE